MKGLIFIISLILSIILTPLRGGYVDIFGITGFSLCSLVGFVLIATWTIFCLRKYSKKLKTSTILFLLFLGISIIDIVIRLISISHFESMLGSFPNLIIWNLGIVVGYLFSLCKKNVIRGIYIIISLMIGYWLSVPGYNFFIHNLNFGTFNGKVVEHITFPVSFQNQNDEDVVLSALKGKYVVLDFWSSSCGICFKEFPMVQELYNEIKENNDILFYSVFCRNIDKKESIKTGYEILEKRGYSFPCLSIIYSGYNTTALNIKSFPTVLIIDKKSNIIFRGDLKSAINIISKLN